ncbi:hypothetical protein AVEN_8534-1 [Araneus ventricosus]|uniref:Uncharacterized protein n=1 Tax=Araneus ventricosus TaxID=182803 RepID=A0A4Y2FQC1_ARAVE|nr:hypothetical protein AVEN_8534-1 [Araneus ventricosus]
MLPIPLSEPSSPILRSHHYLRHYKRTETDISNIFTFPEHVKCAEKATHIINLHLRSAEEQKPFSFRYRSGTLCVEPLCHTMIKESTGLWERIHNCVSVRRAAPGMLGDPTPPGIPMERSYISRNE